MGTVSAKPVLRLDWCSHAAAKYAVEHWHYSQSLPTPPLVKIGAWEDERYIGCVLFSRGANNNIGKAFGLQPTEIAELTRIALDSHKTPVSRVIAIAIRMLREQSAGLRLIVSYADTSQGHHGGIYQGSNWVYCGRSAPMTKFVARNGKKMHGRMVTATGLRKSYGSYVPCVRFDECTPIQEPGKHKYLYALDDAMRAQIAPLAKPYPKRPRADSIAADAPGVHPGEGGSIPTSALHNPATRADLALAAD